MDIAVTQESISLTDPNVKKPNPDYLALSQFTLPIF